MFSWSCQWSSWESFAWASILKVDLRQIVWNRVSLKTALIVATVTAPVLAVSASAQSRPMASGESASKYRAVLSQYCLACHGTASKTAGLDLESLLGNDPADHPEIWEAVVRKLRGRQMPPVGLPRPDGATYDAMVASLAESLDRDAESNPNPGRIATFRRLNRSEYGNAIRDLLALDVDVSSLLPGDEASHGFDNITVGDLPPMLLERYVSAAEKISRLAVGRTGRLPEAKEVRVPPDLTQERHIPGLPVGTRGGALVPYTFPVDGEYDITVRLARDRNEDVEGLNRAHQLELLVDRERVALLDVKPPPRGLDHRNVDSHLTARVKVAAGPRQVGATFLKDATRLLETQRQPYQARFNYYRHRRTQPAIFSVTIMGPYSPAGTGRTPSRERIFVCEPSQLAEEEECARQIVRTLAGRAYRRPVDDAGLEGPMRFYRTARSGGGEDRGFEHGIERALAAILVSPQFLFRIERDPPGVEANTAYRISDLELASRLSFFLWSSIPDDVLLEAAVRGELSSADGLERQVRRMLADPKSQSLVNNFAAQWLHLRNLEGIRPNMRLFPDFDENLRRAFRTETELLLQTVIREDRSIIELLRPEFAFLNERLAKHYGIPNVYGSWFRRIPLDEGSNRGGLLRHGSVLTVTSYATRTSPVIRGKWILENILGMPPPPPPADVPELSEKTISGDISVRERLAEHRADPACSGCHNPMDPLGFALENYDAVGRWRTVDLGLPIDPSGELVDGTRVSGVADLEEALLQSPEVFASTLTEKLLTFALGRGVDYYDAPAIRRIVRNARANDFRFSSLILGISASTPFQMRNSK